MTPPTAAELRSALDIIQRKAAEAEQRGREAEAQEQWVTAAAYRARELGLRDAVKLLTNCLNGELPNT